MAKIHDIIDGRMADFLLAQPVFFVGTAPLAADGHLNISPKGMAGTFAVLGPLTVGYLDYTGSGVETIAHLGENSRIVLMFCAFEGPPNIVRLHGRGRVLRVGSDGYDELRARFSKPDRAGERSIIVVDVDRVADACGYSVPHLEFAGDREILDRSHRRRNDEYFKHYWNTRNDRSIDGLPGLR